MTRHYYTISPQQGKGKRTEGRFSVISDDVDKYSLGLPHVIVMRSLGCRAVMRRRPSLAGDGAGVTGKNDALWLELGPLSFTDHAKISDHLPPR